MSPTTQIYIQRPYMSLRAIFVHQLNATNIKFSETQFHFKFVVSLAQLSLFSLLGMIHPGIEIHFPHWLKPLKVVKYSLTNFPNSSDRNTTCVQSQSNIFKLKCQNRDQSETYLDFETKFQNSNEHNIPPPYFDKYENSFMTENRNGETLKNRIRMYFCQAQFQMASLALVKLS